MRLYTDDEVLDLFGRVDELERQVKALAGSVRETRQLVLRVVATQLLAYVVLVLFVIAATVVGRVL